MLKKLRIKFVCINMTIVTIMLVIVFLVLFISTSHTLEVESTKLMHKIAADPMRLHIPKERLSEIRRPYFAVRIGSDGEPTDAGGSYFDLSDHVQLTEIIQSAQESQRDSGMLPDYHLRFSKNTTPQGEWMVFVDTTNEQSALKNMVKNSAWIGSAAFLLFLAISIFLARWAVKPVDDAWRQQKQFIADASHELKTPLTIITTNAELLLEKGSDEIEKEQFSAGILNMSRQMRGLVERMLDLARADDGSAGIDFRRVDFSEIITDAVLQFEPIFFERGIRFETEIAQGVFVKGSAIHLNQLAEILLDNAQKYTSFEGAAFLHLQQKGCGRCLLTVSDIGDPIPKDELKNIFKRFYRVEKARNMHNSYGLGLSIAQSIVDAHRGRIWAESKDGLNTFYVDLPITQHE